MRQFSDTDNDIKKLLYQNRVWRLLSFLKMLPLKKKQQAKIRISQL